MNRRDQDEFAAEERAAESRGDYLSPREHTTLANKAADNYETNLGRDLRQVKRCGCGCAT